MTTILPGYPAVVKALGKTKAIHQWDSLLGEPARLLSGKLNGHPLLVVDSPNLFAREGGPMPIWPGATGATTGAALPPLPARPPMWRAAR
jgi:hypothetical protein